MNLSSVKVEDEFMGGCHEVIGWFKPTNVTFCFTKRKHVWILINNTKKLIFSLACIVKKGAQYEQGCDLTGLKRYSFLLDFNGLGLGFRVRFRFSVNRFRHFFKLSMLKQ